MKIILMKFLLMLYLKINLTFDDSSEKSESTEINNAELSKLLDLEKQKTLNMKKN